MLCTIIDITRLISKYVADTLVKPLAIPDFVYSTAKITMVQKIREFILPFDCETITDIGSFSESNAD